MVVFLFCQVHIPNVSVIVGKQGIGISFSIFRYACWGSPKPRTVRFASSRTRLTAWLFRSLRSLVPAHPRRKYEARFAPVKNEQDFGEYVFYTNTQRIQVSIPKNVDYESEVILWDVTSRDDPSEIAYSHVNSGNKICCFSNLVANRRYMVTCDSDEQVSITISDGRIVSFWYSLGNVLKEIVGRYSD